MAGLGDERAGVEREVREDASLYGESIITDYFWPEEVAKGAVGAMRVLL